MSICGLILLADCIWYINIKYLTMWKYFYDDDDNKDDDDDNNDDDEDDHHDDCKEVDDVDALKRWWC